MRAAVFGRADRIGGVEVPARRRPVRKLFVLERGRRRRPVQRVLVKRPREVDELRVARVDERTRSGAGAECDEREESKLPAHERIVTRTTARYRDATIRRFRKAQLRGSLPHLT